jgi:hypothetical protein
VVAIIVACISHDPITRMVHLYDGRDPLCGAEQTTGTVAALGTGLPSGQQPETYGLVEQDCESRSHFRCYMKNTLTALHA